MATIIKPRDEFADNLVDVNKMVDELMNKLTARRLAVTTWLTLTSHYLNNMVGLTQYDNCYDVRFYSENGKPDKEEVIDLIAYLNGDNVSLRSHTYNENKDWQLHIEIGFKVELKTN